MRTHICKVCAAPVSCSASARVAMNSDRTSSLSLLALDNFLFSASIASSRD